MRSLQVRLVSFLKIPLKASYFVCFSLFSLGALLDFTRNPLATSNNLSTANPFIFLPFNLVAPHFVIGLTFLGLAGAAFAFKRYLLSYALMALFAFEVYSTFFTYGSPLWQVYYSYACHSMSSYPSITGKMIAVVAPTSPVCPSVADVHGDLFTFYVFLLGCAIFFVWRLLSNRRFAILDTLLLSSFLLSCFEVVLYLTIPYWFELQVTNFQYALGLSWLTNNLLLDLTLLSVVVCSGARYFLSKMLTKRIQMSHSAVVLEKIVQREN